MEITWQKASTLNINLRIADLHFVQICFADLLLVDSFLFVPPPIKLFLRHVRFIKKQKAKNKAKSSF
jgi:hypothetical protein